jgi:hypothetical protein
MKMTATGSAAIASTPVVVAGGSEAALLTHAVVQGTVQTGRAIVSEVARYGVKGAILENPVTTTVVATEATATTAAVVSGADTPVSASEAAVVRRIKNTATRMVESSTSIGTKSVPQSMGALSEGSVGAARVPGSHVEQELLASPKRPELPEYDGKTTHAVLRTNEGEEIPLVSGNADPNYRNYIAAGHTEGKAAIKIRERESSGGTVFHNNTDGTCNYCNTQVGTLLPEGAALRVEPPPNVAAKGPKWYDKPTEYIGNANEPKPPQPRRQKE